MDKRERLRWDLCTIHNYINGVFDDSKEPHLVFRSLKNEITALSNDNEFSNKLKELKGELLKKLEIDSNINK